LKKKIRRQKVKSSNNKGCLPTRLKICTHHLKYYQCDKNKKNEIDWACCMHGEKGCIQDFGRKILRAKDHLRNLGVDGRIILKCVFINWDRVMDLIDIGHERYR
jgi:hypothetical protein